MHTNINSKVRKPSTTDYYKHSEAGGGAGAQSVTVKSTDCGFDVGE